jgi:hypothetical protein
MLKQKIIKAEESPLEFDEVTLSKLSNEQLKDLADLGSHPGYKVLMMLFKKQLYTTTKVVAYIGDRKQQVRALDGIVALQELTSRAEKYPNRASTHIANRAKRAETAKQKELTDKVKHERKARAKASRL